MFIFQPDRHFLRKQIKEKADKIKGVFLDAGEGKDGRYAGLFKYEKRISLDLDDNKNADLLASVEKIPLEDESVDSILCTQVLGDVKNFFKAISELYRILRPNGNLLISESMTDVLHDEPNDFWRFTNFGLKFVLEEAGFKVEEIIPRGGFFSLKAQQNIRYLIIRLNLYKRKNISFFLSPLIVIYGKLMIIFDRIDKSEANKKYVIGWLVIAKK